MQKKYNLRPIEAKKWLKRNNTTKLRLKLILENFKFTFPQVSQHPNGRKGQGHLQSAHVVGEKYNLDSPLSL